MNKEEPIKVGKLYRQKYIYGRESRIAFVEKIEDNFYIVYTILGEENLHFTTTTLFMTSWEPYNYA